MDSKCQLSFAVLTMGLLAACGSSDSDSSSAMETILNTAPDCSINQISFEQDSGEKSLNAAIFCTDSDNDVLEFQNLNIDTNGIEVGSHSQSVTVSDGNGHMISLEVTYQITAPEVDDNLENSSTRCQLIQYSVKASPENDVTVVCDENYAYVTSDTYPSHSVMTGIIGANEQVPVPALNYSAPIPLNPVEATSVTSIDAAVGVAVNGVPIYDYSAQGELNVNSYDPKSDTIALGQLDNCGGHAGRGDDYHYHAAPTCMMDEMTDQSDARVLGWGYDGYPLYGYKNPDGSDIMEGDLDVCNSQLDDTFGRRYQLTHTPPYIIQCLVGEVDTNSLPRVSPLAGQDGANARVNLTPPPEGVENLTFAEASDGTRTMNYDYKGQAYYTSYTPLAEQPNCYAFEMKTITGNGKIQTGTYCRENKP